METLTDLDETVHDMVKFEDGSLVEIHGHGVVFFVDNNGEPRAFTSVYYIPELRTNIMSMGQLDEVDCHSVIGGGSASL
jgi:hypothetical protein